MKLTRQEQEALIALLSSCAEGSSVRGRVLNRIRQRIEDLRGASSSTREVRWAAALIEALAEHEDTCPYSRKLFRRVAEDLDTHADLNLGCTS